MSLTPKETEVLYWIYKGYSNARIALEMGISESTVKTHVRHILDETGASDRLELAAKEIERLTKELEK